MSHAPPLALSPTPPTQRLAALDVLRCLAVLLVMFRHITPAVPADLPAPIRSFFLFMHSLGWMGVDLFFVLSGFLVSGLLIAEHQRTGAIDPLRFLIRRGFKIYPAFFFFLFSTVLIQYYWLNIPIQLFSSERWKIQLWPELLFMQAYFQSYWNHTWSLSVEEHFYFALAAAAFLLALPARRHAASPRPPHPPSSLASSVPFLLVALALVLPLLARFLTLPHHSVAPHGAGFNILIHLTPTHLRLDSLALGVFLSLLFHRRPQAFLAFIRKARFFILPLSLAAFILVAAKPLQSPFVLTWGFSLTSLGCAGLLSLALLLSYPSATSLPPPRSSFPKQTLLHLLAAAAFLGRHSYSIYLWHLPARNWGDKIALHHLHLDPSSMTISRYLILLFSVSIGSIFLGLLAAFLIELPFLRLRDRLFPSRSQPPRVS